MIITFDGYKIKIFDDGQSCCENRYMSTDDDLPYFIGTDFLDIEIAEGREVTYDEFDQVHEIEFLKIKTSKGVLTIVNHNEHNGYYGGFGLVAEEI